jgi:UrcA family protein
MKSVIQNATFAFGIYFLGMAGVQAAPAAAAERQIVISYADLDLSGRSGAQALLQRLEIAASVACGGIPDLRELGRVVLYQSCKQKALDGAVASVGSPLVSAVYGNTVQQVASSR